MTMRWCAMALLLLGGVAAAQTYAPATAAAPAASMPSFAGVAQEQQGIDARRARVMAELDAADQACMKKFAVNDCLAKVKIQRNAALDVLRREQTVLNDSQRIQRSQEELQRQEAKARERTQVEADAASAAAQAEDRSAAQARTVAEHAKIAHPVDPVRQPATGSSQPSALEQAQNRAAYQRKLDEVEQHKKDVAKRLKDQPPGVPLPLPNASAAARN